MLKINEIKNHKGIQESPFNKGAGTRRVTGGFLKAQRGITLIALIITVIVPYDKIVKCCNIKSFLSFDDRLRWVKSLSFF
ncbi:MAG: hypothetical protein ACI4VP_00485 [Clostridia bacterium]